MTPEKAYEIAEMAHRSQTDKGGNPYILHPVAVAAAVDTADQKIVALLHDVIEDTDVTYQDLAAEGLSPELLAALRSVTRDPAETYEQFIDRAIANPIGRAVKMADIKDNMRLDRIPNPTVKDYRRLVRYAEALLRIQVAIDAEHRSA